MDDCLAYINPEYIPEYQEYHKAICINLNQMIWNIVFLRKAIEAQEKGVPCRNDFVIRQLYKDEFEILILRLHRTLLDEGSDVMTLPHLKNNLFSKYLIPEKKAEVGDNLRNCRWDSGETVVAKRRIEEAVPTFRTHYIAHSLVGETTELSVSFLDAEKVVMAACDYLTKLSFGLESFYSGADRALLNFKEEKVAFEGLLEDFFRYQITSAWCVKEVSCRCSRDEHVDIICEEINQINTSLRG